MQVSLQKHQCSRQVEACSRHHDLRSQDFLLRSGFHESSQKTNIKESVACTGPLAVEGLGKLEPQDRPRITPHTELLAQPPNTVHLPKLSTWCLDPAGHSLAILCLFRTRLSPGNNIFSWQGHAGYRTVAIPAIPPSGSSESPEIQTEQSRAARAP